jgi:hypothetical protein
MVCNSFKMIVGWMESLGEGEGGFDIKDKR